MSWSPLAGGELLFPKTEKGTRVLNAIKKVAKELDEANLDKVIYQWLLKHPSNIIPVIGTGKIERIKTAVSSLDMEMTLEQWFQIYIAALGKELP